MLLSIYWYLFEPIIGVNANNPEYRESLFGSVTLISLLMAGIFCVCFYLALGRWRSIWHTLSHWIVTLFLCGLAGYTLAYLQAKSAIGAVDGYMIRFAIFNAVYSSVFFFVFSLLFKNFSIYSKRTPF